MFHEFYRAEKEKRKKKESEQKPDLTFRLFLFYLFNHDYKQNMRSAQCEGTNIQTV